MWQYLSPLFFFLCWVGSALFEGGWEYFFPFFAFFSYVPFWKGTFTFLWNQSSKKFFLFCLYNCSFLSFIEIIPFLDTGSYIVLSLYFFIRVFLYALPFIFLFFLKEKRKLRFILFVTCFYWGADILMMYFGGIFVLGNVFGNIPQIIQWYSFFGVSAGSFWVLVINAFLCIFFLERGKKKDFFFL